jgi:hypothetical protein
VVDSVSGWLSTSGTWQCHVLLNRVPEGWRGEYHRYMIDNQCIPYLLVRARLLFTL